MRMAQLADALAHSRSRVTHTVTRMEKAGLVRALRRRPRTGAASSAASPTQGYALLTRPRTCTSTASATTSSTSSARRTSRRSAGS